MFHVASLLVQHKRAVHLTDDFSCGICFKIFANPKLLKQHSLTHNKGEYECKICCARFSTKQNLRYHVLVHSGEKPFECVVCKVTFRRGDSLRTHLRSDMHLKKAQIELQTIVNDPSVLKRENQETAEVEPEIVQKFFACTQCKKRFTQKALLQRHILSAHSTEAKPFKCTYCEKCFSTTVLLSRHEAVHRKEFCCQDCSQAFSSANALLVHMRSVHLHIYPFACDICEACFAAKETLARHKHTHDAPKYQCKGCMKYWTRRDNLIRHGTVCPALAREAKPKGNSTSDILSELPPLEVWQQS